jgi:predicted alpha/beta hydrolase family esterase
MTTTLIIPGLNSSGSAHWQTWFESRLPNAIRVIQADWKRASLPDWSSRVRRDISRHPGPILIAAHSFGALAAVQAAEDYSERIVGALLVAPADPDSFGVSDALPDKALTFPAKIVASRNDPWLRFERAAELAERWGTGLVDLGPAGHINAEAGYGPWPYGLTLLERLASAAHADPLAAREPDRLQVQTQPNASVFPQERIAHAPHSRLTHRSVAPDLRALPASQLGM